MHAVPVFGGFVRAGAPAPLRAAPYRHGRKKGPNKGQVLSPLNAASQQVVFGAAEASEVCRLFGGRGVDADWSLGPGPAGAGPIRWARR